MIGISWKIGSNYYGRPPISTEEVGQMSARLAQEIVALTKSDDDKYNYLTVEYSKLNSTGIDLVKRTIDDLRIIDEIEYETSRNDPIRNNGGDPGTNFSAITQTEVYLCLTSAHESQFSYDMSMKIMALTYHFWSQVFAQDIDRIRLERATAYKAKCLASGETSKASRWDNVIASLT
jgi:hypothetical protein